MNNTNGLTLSINEFSSPSAEYAVTWLWTWNATISREGIDERLSEMLNAGVKSLYVLPLPKDFRPERLRTFLDPEYLSKDFFDLMEYALKKCKELGIMAWIYDEGGWPSGGACYNTVRENPEAKLNMLKRREITLESDQRPTPHENHIAYFEGKRRLDDDYIAARRMTLTEYYIEAQLDDGNRVDNTNRSVTDTFINNTYEKYYERVGSLFGKEIPIFFTDEPGLLRDSIAHRELELFREEYGYDLEDFIYVIEDGGAKCVTEKEIKARIDHLALLGKLFKQNTCIPLANWCKEHGILFGGHLDIDNRPWGATIKGYFSHLDLLRTFGVPGIDVIWEQIRYPHERRAPLDDETRGFGFFPRFASSAARQTGKNLAMTESLAIYGDAITPNELRYAENYQLMRGINVFNFTAMPYGKDRCAPLMMRPAFTTEKPGFYNLKHLNDYYARLSYLARVGKPICDTALYIPCRDFAANPASLDEANVIFKRLGTMLEEKNIPFDIIDDAGILEAEKSSDGLRLGDAVYKHIVTADYRYTPTDVKEKISSMLGEGNPIYTPENPSVRVMARASSDGVLWFFFNEGEPTVCENIKLGDGKNLYLFDAQTGEVYESDGKITLECGEIAVILETDKQINAKSADAEYSLTIDSFESDEYERFVIDYFGIKSIKESGKAPIGDDFSGTVYYKAEYELLSAPKANERYRITLSDTSVSAEIADNDGKICDLGITPMRAIVYGDRLKQRGTLTVKVSNTAANEILAKRYIIDSRPASEVGIYSVKTYKFEERRPEIRIGALKIEKLKN